jgi:hypothetical protein
MNWIMETIRLPKAIEPKEYVMHRRKEDNAAWRATPWGVL